MSKQREKTETVFYGCENCAEHHKRKRLNCLTEQQRTETDKTGWLGLPVNTTQKIQTSSDTCATLADKTTTFFLTQQTLSCASMFDPALMSERTMSAWPVIAAWCNAKLPLCQHTRTHARTHTHTHTHTCTHARTHTCTTVTICNKVILLDM